MKGLCYVFLFRSRVYLMLVGFLCFDLHIYKVYFFSRISLYVLYCYISLHTFFKFTRFFAKLLLRKYAQPTFFGVFYIIPSPMERARERVL